MKRLFLLCAFVVSVMATATSVAGEIGKPFVQIGHSRNVSSVAFSPDGQYLVSGDIDNTIKLWDVQSGKVIKIFNGHSNMVNSVAFSPEGLQLASGSGDKTVKLWDVRSGKLIKTFEGHSYGVYSVAFSPDGQYLVSGSRDKTLKLWDVQSGVLIKTFEGHSTVVTSVDFSSDGQQLVSGSYDKTLRLWGVRSGKLIKTFEGHSNGVDSVAFSPDGQYLVSGSTTVPGTDHDYDEKTLKLWDVQSGKLIKNFGGRRGYSGDIGSIAFSPDGKQLVSGSRDKTLKLWDVQSGKELKAFKGHSGSVGSVAFSPDGKQLVSGSWDKTLKLWDAQSGKELKTFKGHSDTIESVAFSPDGLQQASGGNGKTVKLWDVKSGKLIKTFVGHSDTVESVAFSPDGQQLVSGGHDKTLKLWDVRSGKLIKTFVGHSDTVQSVFFRPDGKQLVSGSWDKTLKLWDVQSGKELHTFKGHSDAVDKAALSPDGKQLVSGGLLQPLKLWDVQSGKLIKTFENHSETATSVAFSPDSQQLVSGNWDKTLKLWDVQSGEVIKIFEGHSNSVISVAFSPDGQQLVSGSRDKTLKLWNVQSGMELKAFKGHSGSVGSVAFSPDGQQLVSASVDKTLRLWDVKSGKELAQQVSFPDGEWVVITPEGYFNASKNGAKYLNVQTGPLSVSGIDAYYEKFYRPDVVKLALAGKHIDTGVRLADLKTPPRVEIIKTASTTNNDSIKVTLKITDLGGGIGDIRLYRNGTAIKLDDSRGLKLISKGQQDKALYKTYQVKLENGVNELKAIAFDEKNWGRSEYAVHNITANIKTHRPVLHALVIGIENYRNKKLNLKYAEDDAVLFANSLKQYSKGLFSEIKVDLLTSRDETTSESITARLISMQKLNPQDLFVFYVASHGTVDDGAYYLITSNVGSTSTRKLKQDALSQETLKSLISNIPTSKKMIVLDTCNSQALGDSLQVAMMTRGMSEDTAMKVLSRAVGSTILSASTSTQEALEGYKGHGLFTYVLSEGLKGKADGNGDGFVKTSELADYIEDTVPELAETVFGREQFPSPARNGQSYPISKIQ